MPEPTSISEYERYRDAIKGRATPLAWLDLDCFLQNAKSLLERSGNLPVRLATKSIRCTSALRYALDLDPRFQGLLCYHAAEAVWLSNHGFSDLVVAYPTLCYPDLLAVSRRVAKGYSIGLMTDHPDQLAVADKAASETGTVQPVWLDLDCSTAFPGLWFGVYRSPVRDMASLDRYLDALENFPNLKFEGLMGYEAQIAGVADDVPGRRVFNRVIRTLKQRSLQQIADRRGAAVARLRQRGFPPLKVNGGGTGSLESTQKEPWVTEVAAGSGLFGPTLFDGYRQFKPLQAVGFALEVNRIAGPDTVTCLGGGYIASGTAGPEKQPSPYLPGGLQLLPREMAGEVQTPLRGEVSGLRCGDPVFFRHAKAGEICEHFLCLEVIRDNAIVDKWMTYRGEGQCFLG